MNTIQETNFEFKNQKKFYRGKVRDVYMFDHKMVIISSDRISAFDIILPRAIPFKGQVLNQISAFFMRESENLVPNWLRENPDPNVAIGILCKPFPIEMVIRGYLAGSAFRAYQDGKRNFNGEILPDGLHENDPLPYPIITPSTKAEQGQHDEDIDTDEIIKQGLVSAKDFETIEHYTKALFKKGAEIAYKQGLILADTKYEFGSYNDKIYLIDEIHTPDSARYFNLEGYEERQKKQEPQPQRSKEMVRKWLMKEGFSGKEGQQMPVMTDELINEISEEYISIYEQLTGEKFKRIESSHRMDEIKNSIENSLFLK